MTTAIPRAWIDDSHAEWGREARSYGPDPDDDDARDTSDDTDEIEVPVFLPEDTAGSDLLTLAEHERRTADAVRLAYPSADYNPHRGLLHVPAGADDARLAVPELAGCRVLQTTRGGCWFDLTPC